MIRRCGLHPSRQLQALCHVNGFVAASMSLNCMLIYKTHTSSVSSFLRVNNLHSMQSVLLCTRSMSQLPEIEDKQFKKLSVIDFSAC